jgi:hypothetical protein
MFFAISPFSAGSVNDIEQRQSADLFSGALRPRNLLLVFGKTYGPEPLVNGTHAECRPQLRRARSLRQTLNEAEAPCMKGGLAGKDHLAR